MESINIQEINSLYLYLFYSKFIIVIILFGKIYKQHINISNHYLLNDIEFSKLTSPRERHLLYCK